MLKLWPLLTWLGFLIALVIARHYGTITLHKCGAAQYRRYKRLGWFWHWTAMGLFVITVLAFVVLINQY